MSCSLETSTLPLSKLATKASVSSLSLTLLERISLCTWNRRDFSLYVRRPYGIWGFLWKQILCRTVHRYDFWWKRESPDSYCAFLKYASPVSSERRWRNPDTQDRRLCLPGLRGISCVSCSSAGFWIFDCTSHIWKKHQKFASRSINQF